MLSLNLKLRFTPLWQIIKKTSKYKSNSDHTVYMLENAYLIYSVFMRSVRNFKVNANSLKLGIYSALNICIETILH